MIPARFDLTIVQGSDYVLHLRVWPDRKPDPAAKPPDLTGWNIELQMREDIRDELPLYAASLAAGNIELAPQAQFPGQFALRFPAADTAALDFDGFLVYDLELTDPTGVVTRYLQGKVCLSREVTRPLPYKKLKPEKTKDKPAVKGYAP